VLAKIAKGILSAAPRFVLVGIALPYVIEYLAPTLSAYVQLPSPSQVWTIFIFIGALYALTNFLQTAFSKGEYPWLIGRLGGGVVAAVFFTFIFGLLPKSLGSAGIQSTGLLSLIYLDIALAYLYLILDFFDARRSRAKKQEAEARAPKT
jgi:uncharacterized membrane protein YuzA (DUF378 family)